MFDSDQDNKNDLQDLENGRSNLRVVSDRVSESYCTVLKNARIKEGYSLKDISEALKIPLFHLQALEDQNYDALPADTYAAGYIRAYAGMLNLNPEGLIKDYKQDKAFKARAEQLRLLEEQVKIEQEKLNSAASIDRTFFLLADGIKNYIQQHLLTITVSVCLTLVALFVLFITMSEQPKEEFVNAIEQVQVESADGSLLISDMDRPKQIASGALPGSALQKNDTLVIRFSDTSWVTVKNQAGDLLHQSRKQAGDRIELNENAPFIVRLSNASSASITLNEKSVDFAAAVSVDNQLHDFEVQATQ